MEAETLTLKLDASDALEAIKDAMTVPALRVKLVHPGAVAPARGSAGAVGYDLSYAGETSTRIDAGAWGVVPTGVAVAIPPGYYGRVAPRSGSAVRRGIDVLAGVIDPDYRGEIKVVLMNHGSEPFWIEPGDRIAQLIIEACATPDVEVVNDLDATDRGEGGFGSTGVAPLA